MYVFWRRLLKGGDGVTRGGGARVASAPWHQAFGVVSVAVARAYMAWLRVLGSERLAFNVGEAAKAPLDWRAGGMPALSGLRD